MPRKLTVFFLVLQGMFFLAGCSDSNLDINEDVNAVHSSGWYLLHRSSTSVTTFAVDCGGCHVVKDLPGPSEPPGCFSAGFDGRICHAKGPGHPPHPMDGSFLQGSAHGKVAKTDLTFCQSCHSSNPTGGPGSNPRFDVGILNPAAPMPGNGCEQCHGINLAHPASWAGPGTTENPNTVFHYSASNIQRACSLCHGVNLDGVGGAGGIAVNCKKCHAETTNFTLDCTSCHQFPPDGVTPEPVVAAEGGILVAHTAAMVANHDQCGNCHGVKNINAGSTGNLNPLANYLPFNKTTDTNGDHWNGKINMNADTQYNTVNFGCDFACHLNDADHQLSSSNLPITLGRYGYGWTLHDVGANWLRKSQHATQALSGSLDCVGCHSLAGGGRYEPPCQGCHQTAPKMDLSNAGCASCHSYPPDGITPVATQPNRAGRHAAHFGLTADTGNCSSCHRDGGTDSLNHFDRTGRTIPTYPAEVTFLETYNAKSGAAIYDTTTKTCSTISCHGGITSPNWNDGTLPPTDPASGNLYCLKCHVAGDSEYNGFYSGKHQFHIRDLGYRCIDCHNIDVLESGVNGSGPTHWSNLDTPAFELAPADTVGGGVTFISNYSGGTCTPNPPMPGDCHGADTW